jgi:hypothetical protein
MDFKHKYLKYKIKYLQLKNQLGGDIKDFINTFNNEFGSNWVITGSEAIKLFLIHFKREDLLKFKPNDVDIIVANKDIIYKETIDGFKRQQSQPERSMTFKKDLKSFDVGTQDVINYYEINGYRLVDPKIMLENYEENLEFRNNSTDKDKIEALKIIVQLVSDLPKQRIPKKEESNVFSSLRRRGSDDDGPQIKRNLF